MAELWMRLSEDLLARISGPMHLRVLLQPGIATMFAVMAGIADARQGKPPFLRGILGDSAGRADMFRDGWKDVGKVFILAFALDVVYQYLIAKFVYPGEALMVAFLLAIVPYLLFRGLVTRLARVKSNPDRAGQ